VNVYILDCDHQCSTWAERVRLKACRTGVDGSEHCCTRGIEEILDRCPLYLLSNICYGQSKETCLRLILELCIFYGVLLFLFLAIGIKVTQKKLVCIQSENYVSAAVVHCVLSTAGTEVIPRKVSVSNLEILCFPGAAQCVLPTIGNQG
jgi:hypothetical protein